MDPEPSRCSKNKACVHYRGAKQYRCRPCGIHFSNNSNLTEHIGSKHMGYGVKEWRLPENKAVRKKAMEHEYYQFIPLNQEGGLVETPHPEVQEEEVTEEIIVPQVTPRHKAIVTRPKTRRRKRDY